MKQYKALYQNLIKNNQNKKKEFKNETTFNFNFRFYMHP